MKIRMPLRKVAAAFLAATAMAGCSVNAPATAPAPAPHAAVQNPVFQVFVDDMDHKKAHAAFMAKLKLTEEQKTQLKGIIVAAIDRAKPIRDELKPLVTAPEIDRTALRTGIEVAMKADAAQDAQTMAEVRNVLTAEQRQILADKLNEMATSQDDPHMKLMEKLMDKVSKSAFSHLTNAEIAAIHAYLKARANAAAD